MLDNESYREQLELARNTTNQNIMYKLLHSPLMRVRRALSKNPNTPKEIINKLVIDPVLNVSYVASTHHNCTNKREFKEELNPCVLCSVPEHTLYCHTCERK